MKTNQLLLVFGFKLPVTAVSFRKVTFGGPMTLG